jgi:hypothetical protein
MTWQYHPDGKLASRADDGVPVGKQVVLVDNSDSQNIAVTGTWTTANTAGNKHGPNYSTHAAGSGANTFTWKLNIPQAGTYQVFAHFPTVSGAATDAKFTVAHAGGSTVATINQTQGAGSWVSLGSFAFAEGNKSYGCRRRSSIVRSGMRSPSRPPSPSTRRGVAGATCTPANRAASDPRTVNR